VDRGSADPVTPSPRHPVTPSPGRLRWQAAKTIASQEIRDAVFGWSLYLTAAVGLLIGTLLVYNVLQAVGESGLQIVGRPLYGSVLVVASLAAVFLAGWAALSIARSRDQGALRVLFFAPVDAVSLLGGHALAALVMYAVFMLLTVPALALLAWLVNLPFPPELALGVLVSPAFVAPAIGIGLFLSAIAGTARGAMFMFGVIVVVALAVQFGYGALVQSPPDSPYYDALLFLRDLLRSARDALRWVSPLALVSEGLDAALRDNWRELGRYVIVGLAGAAVWLALAVWALRRRGVLP
jgi:ABC-type transport system involved in multi-copper enzyme maturation permease subunit